MTVTAKKQLAQKPNLNEILLEWNAPSHPYKKRNKIFYQTIAALTFLFIVIVFFLHEFLLIGVILSIAFVVYVLSTVQPVEIKHKITPLGFEHAGKLYHWVELHAYWFEMKWNQKILVIQTRLPFPGQIRALVTNAPETRLKEILGKYLLHLEKPPKTWSDSLSDWLAHKFPLETSS